MPHEITACTGALVRSSKESVMVAIELGCAAMLALLGAVPSPTPDPKAKATADPAAVLLEKVQKHYEGLQDYTADFIQTYTRVALSRTSESRGKLMLKRPGMMRWEYEKPDPKLWIADGTQLYVYDPEFQQVVIDRNFETARLSESISFLWGEGKLADTFNAKMGDPKEVGAAKDVPVLELTPKRDATYAKLVMVLDPKTGHVVESIIFETSGNKNHFKFKNLKINTGLKKELFTFTPPPDTEIVYR
jgi:outer membrane lipoprotein carrier protein